MKLVESHPDQRAFPRFSMRPVDLFVLCGDEGCRVMCSVHGMDGGQNCLSFMMLGKSGDVAEGARLTVTDCPPLLRSVFVGQHGVVDWADGACFGVAFKGARRFTPSDLAEFPENDREKWAQWGSPV